MKLECALLQIVLIYVSGLLAAQDADKQVQTESRLKREVFPAVGPRLSWQSEPPPKEVTADLYSSVMLECNAGGSPPPTIHWLRNGQRIPQSKEDNPLVDAITEEVTTDELKIGLSSTVSRLYLDCVTPDAEAEYTCVAENNYLRISSSTNLYVSGKPGPQSSKACRKGLKRNSLQALSPARIYMWTSNMVEVEGNDVQLFCRTTGYPYPKVSWLDPEGTPIQPGSSASYEVLETGDLRIRSIGWLEHMGIYTCVADNGIGSSQQEMFLYPTIPDESTGA